jgi:hypothetical protein
MGAITLACAHLFSSPPAQGDDTAVPQVIDDLYSNLRRLRQAGRQTEFLHHAEKLRALAPDDPAGHLLLASARASLGPAFAKDVALHGFARVLALLRDDLEANTAQRTLSLFADLDPGAARRRKGLAAARETVLAWQADLAAGKVLLLTPDKDTLVRAHARATRRVHQIEACIGGERDRIARARARKQAAEKDLAHERARAKRPDAGMIDLQPIVDRIDSSQRTIRQAERVLAEHNKDLAELRQQVDRMAARVAAFT